MLCETCRNIPWPFSSICFHMIFLYAGFVCGFAMLCTVWYNHVSHIDKYWLTSETAHTHRAWFHRLCHRTCDWILWSTTQDSWLLSHSHDSQEDLCVKFVVKLVAGFVCEVCGETCCWICVWSLWCELWSELRSAHACGVRCDLNPGHCAVKLFTDLNPQAWVVWLRLQALGS